MSTMLDRSIVWGLTMKVLEPYKMPTMLDIMEIFKADSKYESLTKCLLC